MNKKWSDLTANQKSKGIAILRQEPNFILRDEDNEVIEETDIAFIKRISEEWLYGMALGLHKNKQAREAREAVTDL